MRKLIAVYGAEMKYAAANRMQYRWAEFFNLLGFPVEPVVYLVVWRTVAEQGGPIGGYGVAEFTSSLPASRGERWHSPSSSRA